MNPRLKALGIKPISNFDIRAMIAIHGKDKNWKWEPKYGPKRYSDTFAEWMVNEAAKDKLIFHKARSRWRRMPGYLT